MTNNNHFQDNSDDDSSSSSSSSSYDDKEIHENKVQHYGMPMQNQRDGSNRNSHHSLAQHDSGTYAAYQIFKRLRYEELRETEFKLSSTDLSRRINQEWNDLDNATKNAYYYQAAAEKDLYATDLRTNDNYGLDMSQMKGNPEYFGAGRSFPGEKTSKKLSRRDPLAPKPPARAYVLYMNEKREELKAANPTLSFAEMQAQIGNGWTSLDEKAKAKYDKLAEKDKERYLSQMKTYEPIEGSGYRADGYLIVDKKAGHDNSMANRKEPKRDPAAPRPPATAFFFFAASRREEIKLQEPNVPFTDLQKQLGSEWQNLNSETKAMWTKSANDAKELYLEDMKSYQPSDPTLYGADGYLIKAKEDKEKKRKLTKTIRDPAAPKPPLTAFFMFMKAHREDIKAKDTSLGFVDLQKKIGIEWANLDEKSKAKYTKKATKERDRYLQAMEKYEPAEGSGFDTTGHMVLKRKSGEDKKPRRDPAAPKIPLHAYGFFVRQRREELKGENRPSHEIISQIGAEWQVQDEKTRSKYVKMAEQDTERYAKEMLYYKPAENSGFGPDGHIIREKKGA